jgi:hypothetical protein
LHGQRGLALCHHSDPLFVLMLPRQRGLAQSDFSQTGCRPISSHVQHPRRSTK